MSVFFGNEINDTTASITAIERTAGSTHNLDTLYARHSKALEVDIVHCLACHTLTINEEQHTLSAKACKIKVSLLIHGIRELHAWHLCLQ